MCKSEIIDIYLPVSTKKTCSKCGNKAHTQKTARIAIKQISGNPPEGKGFFSKIDPNAKFETVIEYDDVCANCRDDDGDLD